MFVITPKLCRGDIMFTHKEYVLEVFKEKSFSKAAKKLYVSQPSLSSTIKRIEKKISAPIFDRSTNPVSVTEIGMHYIQSALEIKKIEESFLNSASESTNILKGEIKVGGSNLFSSYILPPMISGFNKNFPHTVFEIHEDSTKKLMTLLLDGELDIVIDNTVIVNNSITSYFYTSETILLAVPKELAVNETLSKFQLSFDDVRHNLHKESDFPCVSLEKFKDEPFIFVCLCYLEGGVEHILIVCCFHICITRTFFNFGLFTTNHRIFKRIMSCFAGIGNQAIIP